MTQLQRVLDVDLDFFLDCQFIPDASRQGRLDAREATPWTEGRVRHFLEDQCGLRRHSQIRGRFVNEHHEAFWYLCELVRRGELSVPFDVDHVDSHADLGLAGMGNNPVGFVMTELLALDVKDRDDPPEGSDGLSEASFLLFVIACRWVGSL